MLGKVSPVSFEEWFSKRHGLLLASIVPPKASNPVPMPKNSPVSKALCNTYATTARNTNVFVFCCCSRRSNMGTCAINTSPNSCPITTLFSPLPPPPKWLITQSLTSWSRRAKRALIVLSSRPFGEGSCGFSRRPRRASTCRSRDCSAAVRSAVRVCSSESCERCRGSGSPL